MQEHKSPNRKQHDEMTIFWDLNRRIALLALVLPGRVFASWLKELPDSTHEVQTPLPRYYFIKGPMYLRTDGCYSKGNVGSGWGGALASLWPRSPFAPATCLWMLPAMRRGQRLSHRAVPAPLLGPFAPLALPSELARRWLWALGPALPWVEGPQALQPLRLSPGSPSPSAALTQRF